MPLWRCDCCGKGYGTVSNDYPIQTNSEYSVAADLGEGKNFTLFFHIETNIHSEESDDENPIICKDCFSKILNKAKDFAQ